MPDPVLLLHGLGRSARSMRPLAYRLRAEGFAAFALDYPSTCHPIATLVDAYVRPAVERLAEAGRPVHFVTHSLGGILVRHYLEHEEIANLGRVVMLAPPNQGSEVVDSYRNVPGFEALNGPAGMQLGTDEHSIPSQLGPVDFELGVIAGSDTFNPILSQSLPNPDDGKVSVERTKVEGMGDFVVVPDSHPFIMRSPMVINQVILFIETGAFEK